MKTNEYNYVFINKSHKRRLQGSEWHKNKHLYRLIGYTQSLNKNYCVFLRLKSDINDIGGVYWHWLSPSEAKTFEQNKNNYPLLNFEEIKYLKRGDKI